VIAADPAAQQRPDGRWRIGVRRGSDLGRSRFRSPRHAAARDRGIDGACLDEYARDCGGGGSAAGENTQNMSLGAPPSPSRSAPARRMGGGGEGDGLGR
jgi:hypothetical protein